MEDSSNDQRTVWCGNLSEKMTEDVLYELFLQAAPLERVHIPKDKLGKCNNYGFVTFKHLCSVPYAIDLLNGISLYNKKINIKPRCKNVNQSKPLHSHNVPVTDAPVPVNLWTDPRKYVEPSENINFLMQLGNQLLPNNVRQYFAGDYRNEWSPRDRPNYYSDRHEEQRPYRRHNNFQSDRHNVKGRSYDRKRDRY